jgi:hypothetical protein
MISGSRVTLALMDCQMRLCFSASSRVCLTFYSVHFFPTMLGLRVILSNVWVLSRNSSTCPSAAHAIIGPLLPVLGISPVMAAMTICAGAMILMHVNDSFFWVVSGFTKMEVGTAYKTLTVTMAVMGVVVFAGVAILGPLLGFA